MGNVSNNTLGKALVAIAEQNQQVISLLTIIAGGAPAAAQSVAAQVAAVASPVAAKATTRKGMAWSVSNPFGEDYVAYAAASPPKKYAKEEKGADGMQVKHIIPTAAKTLAVGASTGLAGRPIWTRIK